VRSLWVGDPSHRFRRLDSGEPAIDRSLLRNGSHTHRNTRSDHCMSTQTTDALVETLLAEDNSGDVRLIQEGVRDLELETAF